MLSWQQQQQQQHNSRDPPSRSVVTEHFGKCPELMSTRRAPVTLTALPSTRTLLSLRKFPFSPLVQHIPVPARLFPVALGRGEGSTCTRVPQPVFPTDFLLLAGISQRLCRRSKSQMHPTPCLQWKLCLHWGCRTRPSVSYRTFLLS